jgi:hypothetical protein
VPGVIPRHKASADPSKKRAGDLWTDPPRFLAENNRASLIIMVSPENNN